MRFGLRTNWWNLSVIAGMPIIIATLAGLATLAAAHHLLNGLQWMIVAAAATCLVNMMCGLMVLASELQSLTVRYYLATGKKP